MKVDIDLVADAASIEWAPRARGLSQIIRKGNRPGVRVHFNEVGDVVGLEVLGWSRRTDAPTDVDVKLHGLDSPQTLGADHSLVRALKESGLETDVQNRPIQGGKPMLSLPEAARLTGKERSWLSREMASGRLQAMKIGRSWWTSQEWIQSYMQGRDQVRQQKRAAARR